VEIIREKIVSGIFLIAVFIIWLIISIAVAQWVARHCKSKFMRLFSGVVVFPLLLLAPLADEVIGIFQFESLCKKYAVVEIDERNSMNRYVATEIRKKDVYAEGTAVSIRIDPYIYRDTETKQIIVSYHILHAQGGWLVRFLGISETNAPLLFGSGCEPKDVYAFKRSFDIKVVN
jgi:hypothetical protein